MSSYTPSGLRRVLTFQTFCFVAPRTTLYIPRGCCTCMMELLCRGHQSINQAYLPIDNYCCMEHVVQLYNFYRFKNNMFPVVRESANQHCINIGCRFRLQVAGEQSNRVHVQRTRGVPPKNKEDRRRHSRPTPQTPTCDSDDKQRHVSSTGCCCYRTGLVAQLQTTT